MSLQRGLDGGAILDKRLDQSMWLLGHVVYGQSPSRICLVVEKYRADSLSLAAFCVCQ